MKDEQGSVTALLIIDTRKAQIRPSLQALLNSSCPLSQILVVDNASADNTVHLVEANFPNVQIITSDRNLGFAGGVNLGLTQATGDLIAIVNPDVVVEPEWLSELVKAIGGEQSVGIVGGKLLFGDGRTIQHAGGILRYPLALADHYGYRELDVGRYDRQREVDYVTGAAVVVRREVLQELGGLDEGFYPAYFEETDLCWRIRKAGLKVLYVPTAVGIHYESTSTVRDSYIYYYYYHRNRLRFVLKHYTPDQFLNDFFPAEMERLSSVYPQEEKKALAAVYQEASREIPHGDDLLALSDGAPPVLEAIDQISLRTSELSRTWGERREVIASDLARLRESSHVLERPFTSGMPVIGPVIARFRAAWNWVSTKWYVRQLLQQQNQINAEIVELNVRLVDYVAELQQKLAELGRQAQEVEQMAIHADRKGVELTQYLAQLNMQVRKIEGRTEAISSDITRKPG